ncbi:cytochrome P450 736A117-like [Silene latifolia]|uniref:cytochrome P450 736A117-like n=1 Tax=Silene latifolia TaxID=37657 RepID=UPI003D76FAD2
MFLLSIQQLNLNCFQFFTVLSFLIFLLFLYRHLLTKSTPTKHYPPNPPKLPLLGNIHQLGRYPHRSLQSLSKRYGDIMFIYLGRRPTLIVSSDKAAREIMKTQDATFSNRPSTKTGNKLLYNGKDVAAAQYGEYWRQMKSICILQLLSPKRVRSFRHVREEETALLMEMIQKTSLMPVNLSKLLLTLTNNVICRVAFGRKYSQTEGGQGGTEFSKLLREFLEMLGTFRVGDFIPSLAWTNRLDGWDAKVDRVAKEFDEFLEQVVKEHEDRQCDDEDKVETEKVKDFVDVLLDIQKDKTAGFAIERDSIKAIILDMFAGGTDTTYTVLEWAMTEIIRHPKVMHELQKEIREITGTKYEVNEDDLKQMKYLKAVIKETLRLHPPIPLLVPRLSLVDAKVNGYDIPAGTGVITNAWAIQRDPATWEEPETFNPERFLNSPTDFKGQDFELIPFGSGRRICPGILFAISNNELVLANLMHKFDWTLPGGANSNTLDASECKGLTIHRKTPLLVVATSVVAAGMAEPETG